MSVRIIDAVFRHSKSKAAARLVLLALADVAADSGEVTAYKRSQSILAAKANVDAGTVRRAIATLEELGELVVLERGDGRRSTNYLITVTPSAEGVQPDGPQPAAPGGAGCAPTPGDTRAQGVQGAPPIIPSLPLGDPSPPVEAPRAKKATQLPADWCVTDDMRAWAAENTPTVDVDAQADLFADHWRSKGERRSDWLACWRNWLRRSVEYSGARARPRPAPPGRPTAPRQATGGGRVEL